MDEFDTILEAYRRHREQFPLTFFTYENMAHLCRIQERHRATLTTLARAGYCPLAGLRILDVGCGDGNMLRQFLQWGALPENLAGIDLRPAAADYARSLNPNLDVRCGDAIALPWPDESFDLVCQHTVFTSIVSPEVRKKVANEMCRVLRPGRAILWYDFIYNNPRNPNVRGIPRKKIQALFPDFDVRLCSLTLISMIARRLPEPLLPVLYPLLSAVRPLRTHCFGLLIKPVVT